MGSDLQHIEPFGSIESTESAVESGDSIKAHDALWRLTGSPQDVAGLRRLVQLIRVIQLVRMVRIDSHDSNDSNDSNIQCGTQHEQTVRQYHGTCI